MAIDQVLNIRDCPDGEAILVTAAGTLDSASYMSLRTALLKAAADEPSAVIVDVDRLTVPDRTAWSVLTSVRWHTSTWPAVPLGVVASSPRVRATLTTQGVARYVPVYTSQAAASSAIADGTLLRAARVGAVRDLPRHRGGHALARAFIRQTLQDWSAPNLCASAEAIAFELVGNVLAHTDSAPRLRLELDHGVLTVAVSDRSGRPAVRAELASGASRFSGLGVVTALSRTWGCMPTRDGKVVWAVIGPRR